MPVIPNEVETWKDYENLSVRLQNILSNMGSTIDPDMGIREWLSVRNMGRNSVAELAVFFAKNGYPQLRGELGPLGQRIARVLEAEKQVAEAEEWCPSAGPHIEVPYEEWSTWEDLNTHCRQVLECYVGWVQSGASWGYRPTWDAWGRYPDDAMLVGALKPSTILLEDLERMYCCGPKTKERIATAFLKKGFPELDAQIQNRARKARRKALLARGALSAEHCLLLLRRFHDADLGFFRAVLGDEYADLLVENFRDS